ncbi:DNA-binding protein inhibitor ID-4 [Syngnathoides biaculeatus]|uniref:DNA-binding protein inhibitor ID-4 n=1 Tax=Syngnathoides biaculeatus TaxID=300417 RepID=UPI002ADE0802|nr:DNA-binding protein inhibitor ID-4 [Syngnathoides biaculeatus]
MKAVPRVHPQDSWSSSSFCSSGRSSSGSSNSSSSRRFSLHYPTKQSFDVDDRHCLQHDMNDCYSRLKRLVPTIPQDKKVSKVEILQHVIDYILELQLALETHPSLHKERSATCVPLASNPSRAPLTVLNIDHHQRTAIVKKPEDSILCR